MRLNSRMVLDSYDGICVLKWTAYGTKYFLPFARPHVSGHPLDIPSLGRAGIYFEVYTVQAVVYYGSDSYHEWDVLVVQSWSLQTWYEYRTVKWRWEKARQLARKLERKGGRQGSKTSDEKKALLTDQFSPFWNMCLSSRCHRSKHVMAAGKGAAAGTKRGARKANAPRKCPLLTLTMPSLNASRASLAKDAQSDDETIRVA